MMITFLTLPEFENINDLIFYVESKQLEYELDSKTKELYQIHNDYIKLITELNSILVSIKAYTIQTRNEFFDKTKQCTECVSDSSILLESKLENGIDQLLTQVFSDFLFFLYEEFLPWISDNISSETILVNSESILTDLVELINSFFSKLNSLISLTSDKKSEISENFSTVLKNDNVYVFPKLKAYIKDASLGTGIDELIEISQFSVPEFKEENIKNLILLIENICELFRTFFYQTNINFGSEFKSSITEHKNNWNDSPAPR